ncbi:universal stress protein [Pseudomonas rhizosphaerae]|uniref:universal stress protein n=1 Tax=Pseudomonas rhizosphaerae TaxID=216142 RepID=UPI001784F065|nr:universal stress protein [Pseudomonas rhizosphaerae]MBD8613508.1 universal stress protein [Pseudomonas putida]MEB2871203.1 universal stress protein [Pseudomonas rhizosphaerae]
MIRSMLYATDLGLYAPFVMQHAVALARSFNAQLYVIHAVEPMGLIAESVLQSYLDESTLDRLHNQGLNTVMAGIEERVLQSLRSDLGDDEPDLALIRAVRVRQGDPAQVILDQAQRLAVDLLVLGSHSHGAAVDVSLGRTATRVLQLSPVPIYMVPLTEHRSRMKS